MIDFPNSPTDGQIFSAPNGVVYKYSSAYTSWLAQNPAPPLGGTGDFYAMYTGAAVGLPASPAVTGFNSVISGNSGGWYTAGRYTPPAGRYSISTGFSIQQATTTPSSALISIRKNGTAVATSVVAPNPANGYGAPAIVQINADANGTDYFDVVASQTASGLQFGVNAGTVWFGASPLTGMQGPTGVQPTGGGIIRDVTLSSPAATIDLFSLGVKSVQVVFSLQPVTDNVFLYMRSCVGTTPDASATYSTLILNNNHATPATASGAFNSATTAYQLANSVANTQPVVGDFTIPNLAAIRGSGKYSFYLSGSGAFYQFYTSLANGSVSTTNGLQFFFSSGNLAAGSFVRVIGWP